MTVTATNATTNNTIATDTAEFVRSDWSRSSFREKFGQSLLTEDEKRLLQYRDMDIAQVNSATLRMLDRIDMETKGARTVAESFTPAAGLDLRLRIPLRA